LGTVSKKHDGPKDIPEAYTSFDLYMGFAGGKNTTYTPATPI
jgi:hypothetical protein